jgi:hypothetical protein
MNIYQELFSTKIFDKLWPSNGSHGLTSQANQEEENQISSNETATRPVIMNSFTESFFEKIALAEFENSIYNNLSCSKILYSFYEKIVMSEMRLIRNNSVNTIIVNPLHKMLPSESNHLNLSSKKNFKFSNKKLSLNILDFGKFTTVFFFE